MWNIIFILLFTFSTALGFNPVYLQKNQIKTHCEIYNFESTKLYSLPGEHCTYKSDGSVVYFNEHSLAMVSADNAILWKQPGHFHHQIKWSIDQKNILAMDSEIIDMNGNKYRSDQMKIISAQGVVLKKINILEVFNQTKAKIIYRANDWFFNSNLPKVSEEISHINSFYEIPNHTNKKNIKFIPPGGYVINGVKDGIYILDPNLSKVLYHFDFPYTLNGSVHDVQVTSRGTFIMFVNIFSEKPGKNPPSLYSAGVEYDPFRKKIIWKFTASQKELFYSSFGGGIQEIDKSTILISDNIKGFYLINKNNNSIQFAYTYLRKSEFVTGIATYQDIKFENLNDFLKSRKNQ